MSDKKTVVITGGSRGIGAAIAHRYAQENYNIAIISRSGSQADHIQALEAEGVQVVDLKGDIADSDFAKAAIKEIRSHFGRIDVLVNNAGITKDGLMMRMKSDAFDDVLAVNLKGAFNMMQAVSKVMLKQKAGAIINMASVVAQTGNVGQVNYAASKAGLIGMTKTAARELGGFGITVNAIAPGYIETEMTDAIPNENKAAMLAMIPLGRFGQVDEIADVCYHLSQATYITGSTIDVNGGMYMN
ncbi:beta-ketoacyl-ACP reductase [Aerococcus urinaehominis]|uniref:Beta-ketoacyl-ACP reductase n=1 Tax=Aerococcus urinaehominis TaxID=128944 RepID=A0A0X8FJI8_9LACT|nr:beta-ketoacyl-ACP reductase [Aerococcus urinaehominis]AMB98493.1 beta-ketoacyl-ACP reductase [Aerococcus urinaehominis]SDL80874.1 3-oxoacyl-[acyl-carrier-protein] reductase [Aerococcus urinaehominis]